MSALRLLCALASIAAWACGCSLVGDELYDPLDEIPPEVVDVFPPDGWIQVPPNASVRIRFSEAVDPDSVGPESVYLYSGALSPQGRYRVEVEPDGCGLATFEPYEPLLGGVRYRLYVTEAVCDLLGNPLAAPFKSTFTTVR
ncbi:MAG: Ig-like domain-containing protein [Deltaproteobacteria bacterium]|nr:Ig-like domain-containing protein [Deltaproteobacteria bacterium]